MSVRAQLLVLELRAKREGKADLDKFYFALLQANFQ